MQTLSSESSPEKTARCSSEARYGFERSASASENSRARAHLGRAAVRNVQLQRRHAFADDVEDGRHAPAAHDLP